jgi:predicted lipid-binding transport protein (Tim44 family)
MVGPATLAVSAIFLMETLMKKWLSLLAVVMTLGLSTVHLDAEAKRMGGGKSFGMQRQATPPAKAPTPPAAAAPAAAGAAGAAATTGRSWMGPVAGLATGLGIAALASHLGFGEELANMLMLGLLVVAAIAVFGFIMRKRAGAQTGGNGGLAYAGAGASRAPQNPNAFRAPLAHGGAAGGSMIGSAIGGQTTSTGNIPADFDVTGFERNAKVNFIRLQAANDADNLDDIRAFTTPEMFAELSMDLSERGAAEQHTDVVRIDASVIDVEEDADRYVVSVRFTGETREDGAAMTENFDEIWHLTKPRRGNGGWLLAGIQQSA